MKNLAAAVTFALLFASSAAAQQPKRVAPSGRGISEVVITFVDSAARANATPQKIRIDYGAPNLRGRMLHTDSLVPYDKVWRTGANEATTLTTDVDLTIGGKSIPAGKYVVQSLPSRSGWKLLFHKDGMQVSTDSAFNAAHYVALVDMRATKAAAPIETLSMWLVPSRDPGAPKGQLIISWGTVSLSTDWAMK